MISARIQTILRDCASAHAQEIAFQAAAAYEDVAVNCDSEIERLLLAPLMFIKPQCLHGRYEGPADREHEARLFAQYPVGGRRLDFAYIVQPLMQTWEIRVGIECDGHAYHSSVEQRANDNLRGVEIIKEEGFNIVRFSGSQINANPLACAKHVSDVVDSIYQTNIFSHVNRSAGKAYTGPMGPLLAKVVRDLGEGQP